MSFSAFDLPHQAEWKCQGITFSYPTTSAKSLQQWAKNIFVKKCRHNKQNIIFKNAEIILKGGQCYALSAPNGAGKTTLFRILSSILPGMATQSNLKVVSFIDSTAPFITNISVELNIKIFLTIHNSPSDEVVCREILNKANLLDYRQSRIENLSSGMISRLCLALLYFLPADLVLLDEVINYGDLDQKKELAQLIEYLRSRGQAIIIAGHDLQLMRMCCTGGLGIDRAKIIPFPNLEDCLMHYETQCSLGNKSVH